LDIGRKYSQFGTALVQVAFKIGFFGSGVFTIDFFGSGALTVDFFGLGAFTINDFGSETFKLHYSIQNPSNQHFPTILFQFSKHLPPNSIFTPIHNSKYILIHNFSQIASRKS
jgi:hypothetical protein